MEKAMVASPQLKFNVEWQPFFLNSSIPKQGIPLQDYLGERYGKEKFDLISSRLEKTGNTVGINFRRDRLIVNSLDSHRLVEFAKKHSKQNEAIEAIFHNYFEECKDISSKSVLVSVAESVGLDKSTVEAYLDSSDNTDLIVQLDNMWKMKRINGVPFFMISTSGESPKRPIAFSGAQPPEVFLDAFQELSG